MKLKKILSIACAVILLTAVLVIPFRSSQAATVGKVTKLTATIKSYNSITLTWKKVSGCSGYEVYKSTDGKKYSLLKKIGSKETTLKEKSLKTGTKYYYKMRAYKKSKDKKGKTVTTYGSYSAVVSAKPVLDRAEITKIKNKAYNAVTVYWNRVAGADGYIVYKSVYKDKNFGEAVVVKNGDKLSAVVTPMVSGRPYYFKVIAYRNVSGKRVVGKESKIISAISVPEKITTNAPRLLSRDDADGSYSALISWTFGSGAMGYNIYRSENSTTGYKLIGKNKSNSEKNFTDKGLKAGKTYYYKVASYRTYENQEVVGELSSAIKVEATNEFTIGPNTTPYANQFMSNNNYDETSKQYYTWKTYLELIEALGGGTLNVTAGTYSFTKLLYLPSNLNLNLADGVTINGKEKSVFFFCNPSDAANDKKYSKYDGVHDINITGTGKVVMDKHGKEGNVFVILHTRNIKIEGITFKNMNGRTHFIELDASKNVTIKKCTFDGYTAYGGNDVKEAINLDIPDPNLGGVTDIRTTMDKTVNDTIYITDNVFKNLPAAVGTHLCSSENGDERLYKNVHIENNVIKNCNVYGIRAMAWENAVIKNNKISNIGSDVETNKNGTAIYVQGSKGIVVQDNEVDNAKYFMYIRDAALSDNFKNSHPGCKNYTAIAAEVNEENVIFNKATNISKKEIVYETTDDKKVYWTLLGLTTEEPTTEEPTTEEPTTEEPTTEEPTTEEPTTEEPTTEEPTTEEPTTEEPTTEEPMTEEPTTEEPVTEEPVTEAPITEDSDLGGSSAHIERLVKSCTDSILKQILVMYGEQNDKYKNY